MPVDLTPPPTRTRRVSNASGTAKSKNTSTPSQEMDARTQERKDGLDGYVQTGVAVSMLLRQHADAQALAVHGPKITAEVAQLANRYEKLGTAIDKMIAAGPFAALAMAVMPLAMQLAVNHGYIKNPAMLAGLGVQPKEALEAEGKAAEQRMVLDALQKQRDFAEQEAKFQRELAQLSESNGHGIPE